MYRAAIIGCGKIGSEFAETARVKGIFTHADAYGACRKTRLAAVCDIDRKKLAKCGKTRGITALYTDPARLLEEQKPDIVSICTPDSTHYDLIRLALATGHVKAILAEKPLALSVKQARDLVAMARRKNVVLAVNYMRRYARGLIRLREMIRVGNVGKVQIVAGLYSRGTLHNGTHWFDLARFLCGDIASVRGRDALREKGGDPTLDALLGFASGATGSLHGCDARAYGIFEMDIVGTEGRVRITDGGHCLERYRVGGHPRYRGLRVLVPEKRIDDGGLRNILREVVRDVVESLETGRKPRCPGEDAMEALRIAVAVAESAKRGSVVRLESRA